MFSRLRIFNLFVCEARNSIFYSFINALNPTNNCCHPFQPLQSHFQGFQLHDSVKVAQARWPCWNNAQCSRQWRQAATLMSEPVNTGSLQLSHFQCHHEAVRRDPQRGETLLWPGPPHTDSRAGLKEDESWQRGSESLHNGTGAALSRQVLDISSLVLGMSGCPVELTVLCVFDLMRYLDIWLTYFVLGSLVKLCMSEIPQQQYGLTETWKMLNWDIQMCTRSTCCTCGQWSHDAVGCMTQLFMKLQDIFLILSCSEVAQRTGRGLAQPGTVERGVGLEVGWGRQASCASAADTRRAVIPGLSGRKRRTSRAHKCASAAKRSSAPIQDGQLWRVCVIIFRPQFTVLPLTELLVDD